MKLLADQACMAYCQPFSQLGISIKPRFLLARQALSSSILPALNLTLWQWQHPRASSNESFQKVAPCAGVSRTNDKPKFANDDVETELLAIFTSDGFLEEAGDAQASSTMGLILRDTSFYAEMGGQVGDWGSIRSDDDTGNFTVSDTKVRLRPMARWM